jgi:glutathione S-transferase
VRLYHLPPSRSMRVLWLLEEIGEPYDVTVLTGDERRTDEHKLRHPLGRVPVLEDDEGFLFESAALCLQLADVYPDAQLSWPLGTHERGLVYQWVMFSMTELEPAVIEVRAARRAEDAARTEAGVERFRTAAAVIETALAGCEYLVGGRFSVADLVCGAVLGFGKSTELIDELPNIEAYVERLDVRPARARARAVS